MIFSFFSKTFWVVPTTKICRKASKIWKVYPSQVPDTVTGNVPWQLAGQAFCLITKEKHAHRDSIGVRTGLMAMEETATP